MTMQPYTGERRMAPYEPMGGSREILDDDLPSGGFLPSVKVDAGGRIWFNEDTQVPAETTVYPLEYFRRRIRWGKDGYEPDDAYINENKPLCKSSDGKAGEGILVEDGVASGACASCPEAKWQENAQGELRVPPRCSEIRAVRFLLDLPNGSEEGEIEFKGSNMDAFKGMAKVLKARGWGPPTHREVAFAIAGEARKRGSFRWGVFVLRPLDQPPQVRVDVEATARPVEDDVNDLPW